ncbi:MAG: tRNA (adenosine(37)-N6)-threonylcarbamoyltransferase complex transferase subunit TsaD [Rickettsiales bacterium]|nr:tRNA (adenosine(37)-N6)-threonylcarbamoyltransferase complex transferase subunit TsaD [Rickettsiales bacterium]
MIKILAIETSCDETAVAVVSEDKNVHFNRIISQAQKHAKYGGIIPEIASRSHLDDLDSLLAELQLLQDFSYNNIDAIAVTAGPGLIGGLIVGVMYAKALSATLKKPIIAVNHLEGHALTCRLTNDVEYPFLLLLVSGGHSQILIVNSVNEYIKLGTTLDDAVGEAFDKTAKMLGLGYPGGPVIEQRAKLGDKTKYKFPRPLSGQGMDLSFSGLKTSVLRQIEKIEKLSEQDINDICASFQEAVKDVLCDKISRAMLEFIAKHGTAKRSFVVSGGVAANQFICNELKKLCNEHHFSFYAPPISLCGDNAVMIAWAAIERFQAGFIDDITFRPKSRWDLNSMSSYL